MSWLDQALSRANIQPWLIRWLVVKGDNIDKKTSIPLIYGITAPYSQDQFEQDTV